MWGCVLETTFVRIPCPWPWHFDLYRQVQRWRAWETAWLCQFETWDYSRGDVHCDVALPSTATGWRLHQSRGRDILKVILRSFGWKVIPRLLSCSMIWICWQFSHAAFVTIKLSLVNFIWLILILQTKGHWFHFPKQECWCSCLRKPHRSIVFYFQNQCVDSEGKRRIVRKEENVQETNCIIKIFTNRKVSQVKARD